MTSELDDIFAPTERISPAPTPHEVGGHLFSTINYALNEEASWLCSLIGRTVGSLKLYSLLPDADYFVHCKQTLRLHVLNAVG